MLSNRAVPLRVNDTERVVGEVHVLRQHARAHERLGLAGLHRAVVQRGARVRLAEVVAVGREDELLLLLIERERAVVAASGQKGLCGAGGEVADERAVLRRVARDDGVGEDLRAVVERVGEDVVDLLLRAAIEVAEDDGGAVGAAVAVGGTAASGATSSRTSAGAGITAGAIRRRRAWCRGRSRRPISRCPWEGGSCGRRRWWWSYHRRARRSRGTVGRRWCRARRRRRRRCHRHRRRRSAPAKRGRRAGQLRPLP